MPGKRPVYLNLFKIRQPLPAVVSFLHRVSGALLFLAIPLFLRGMQLMLDSEAGFEEVRQSLVNPLVKLAVFGLAWAGLHHFFAGLRFLALDVELGVDLGSARKTSAVVLATSGVLTLLIGVWLW